MSTRRRRRAWESVRWRRSCNRLHCVLTPDEILEWAQAYRQPGDAPFHRPPAITRKRVPS